MKVWSARRNDPATCFLFSFPKGLPGEGEWTGHRPTASCLPPRHLCFLTWQGNVAACVSLTRIYWELVRVTLIYLFIHSGSFVSSPLLPCVQFSPVLWIIYTLSQIHIGNTLWSSCILHIYYILCDVPKIIVLIVLEFVTMKMGIFILL